MPEASSPSGQRIRSVANALQEATDICMARDSRVFVTGEGVADPKGIFGTTSGLIEKYGRDRVVETPVSENGMTGIAIGAAIAGRRPILVHMRVEFALLAMEQIFNNAAKAHYLSLGRHRVPLVLRLIVGRGWGQGPEHSQSLESVFAHVPGLKVVLPTTAREAKGLFIAAVEDDNPVIFLEHRWVHMATGDVPEGHYTVPLVGARQVRRGADVTVVATSYMLFEAMAAVDALTEAGVSADLFDLHVLRPLDLAAVVESVKRTGRLIVVDTGWKLFGAGAEVVAQVVEQAFAHLKGAPARLGLPDHPLASSRGLVPGIYVTSEDIVDAVGRLLPETSLRLSPAKARLRTARSRLPVDVPDPSFLGPF
jgi:pyruvate dehydrogenase E1 component beta subunit